MFRVIVEGGMVAFFVFYKMFMVMHQLRQIAAGSCRHILHPTKNITHHALPTHIHTHTANNPYTASSMCR